MTYRQAFEEMIKIHGENTIYSDGAFDWDADNLREDATDSVLDAYVYSTGSCGSRPGVYYSKSGYIPSVPVVEPKKE